MEHALYSMKMKIVNGLDDPALGKAGCVALSIGVYDGVHLGHAAVISALIREGKRLGAVPAVLTFSPHPRMVLGGAAPFLLTTLEHRLALLGGLGVRLCIVLPFTREVAAMGAGEFVRGLLLEAMDLAGIVVGPRFTFGRGRGGTVGLLRELGKARGFTVTVVGGLARGGRKVSSTAIRGMVRRGDFAAASRLLGRRYSLRGPVERGKGLGAGLGVPTANIALEGVLRPPAGVYAARASVGGKMHDGVLNIDARGVVEIHLFEFSQKLYGKTIEVFPAGRIRAERRFGSPGALARRMQRDIAIARQMLHTGASVYGGSRARRGRPASQSLL